MSLLLPGDDPRHPSNFWNPKAPRYRELSLNYLRFLEKKSNNNAHALLKAIARAKKLGGVLYLLSNFNGTLRIVEEAIAPEVRGALYTIANAGNPVWILSGGSVQGLVGETKVPNIGYFGCNGAETMAPGASYPSILESVKVYQDHGSLLWPRLAQRVADQRLGNGVVFNPLPVGCKVEFFGVEPKQRASTMNKVSEVIRPLIQMTGWVIGPGVNVLTLRLPSETCSKVEGVMSVLRARPPRPQDVVVYAGDSAKPGGDLPVFIALQEALRSWGIQLYCVSVEGHTTPLAPTWLADLSCWRAPGYGGLVKEMAAA